ncbi:aminopeptidase P family protein [Herbiconiux sp. VKM Ac-2851]|uniref:aminopeptidase P family protein n=1 Tax=Herbiconiux sp. VKM Ac-2851 TaxID=2739025 RepID=UPI001C202348|nr:aminopeptidase P family protein [Herbiconiux sp. VKM Ac-2851]
MTPRTTSSAKRDAGAEPETGDAAPPAEPTAGVPAASALWTMPRAVNRSPLPGDGAFMTAGWADPEPVIDPDDPVIAYTAERRSRLAQALPAELLIIPAGLPRVRSNDSDHRFRPGTDHVWLTGNDVAESVLVVDTTGGEAGSILYLRAPSGRDGDEFWQNDALGDLWVGPRPTLAETQAALGIETRPLTDFTRDFERAARRARRIRVLPTLDESVDELVRQTCGTAFSPHFALKAALDELRLIKNDWEIGQLQLAVDGTARGFDDCLEAWQDARAEPRGERYLEGTFARRALVEGEGPAYGSIVAAGSHATTLHYTRNTGPLVDGDLVLMDLGVELPSLYAADITRTLPVSGTFTPLQRDVYSIVLRAQQAGIDALRAGVRFQDYQDACGRSLTEGLIELGLIRCSVDEAMAPSASYHRRWSISRAGHMLGMDVHDCNHAPHETYLGGVLAAGHTLTVEPGLYFQPGDLTVPAELRGLGIRIEDDLVVTETSSILLSAGLPRTPAAVEEWMGALAR